MKKYFFAIIYLVSLTINCFCQNLQPVAGIPTKEIYDLMLDHKGYIWIAHDLGISRYDGVNFTHYSNDQESSLSMTDLAEDNVGRIWCHNFNGQVFFIENQRMKLFEAYDYKKEKQFPRLVLCDHEILITSERGLYAVNTKSLSVNFYPIYTSPEILSISITQVGKKAIIYSNNGDWYVYEHNHGLNKIKNDPAIIIDKTNAVSLEPTSLKDTIYLISNPSGLVQKLLFRKGELKLAANEKYSYFINAVTVDNNEAWIQTKGLSITTDKKYSVYDENITDIITDVEGNIWHSSLKDGLLVQYKKPVWQKIEIQLPDNDYVKCLNSCSYNFIIGTQDGKLLLKDSALKKDLWTHQFSRGDGAIEYIKRFDGNQFIVATSMNSFLVDPVT
ncbi:MAG TPA: hypothetical protein VGO09_07115, partial [Flavisolibacter sp.]|nr:hypothetical protein [Flavisolibacter sp.]